MDNLMDNLMDVIPGGRSRVARLKITSPSPRVSSVNAHGCGFWAICEYCNFHSNTKQNKQCQIRVRAVAGPASRPSLIAYSRSVTKTCRNMQNVGAGGGPGRNVRFNKPCQPPPHSKAFQSLCRQHSLQSGRTPRNG